jgi:tetratricopeptide (TPR) repeat protein
VDDAPTPADPATALRTARARALALAGVLVVVLVAFLPALRCGFVNWDDDAYVVGNPDVASPNLLRILDPTNLVVGDWTPLVTLTFAAERAVFGEGPLAFHATNVLLHLATVALLYGLLRDVGLGATECLLAALIFGVHPLQVESVAWVSARKNLLVAATGFAFLRAHLAGRPVVASVWLVLAALSKGTAVAFPLVAAAATWLGLPRSRPRATWVWIAAWAALAVARGVLSASAQAEIVERTACHGLAGRMATMGVVLATQARQYVAPGGFSTLYHHAARSWAEPAVLASWALVLAIGAAAFVAARRQAAPAFAGALALASLLPTLNVVPAPYFQSDRYVHVALAGAAVLTVAALRPLTRLHRALPAAAVAAWCALVCVPATFARADVWRTSRSLWNSACVEQPEEGTAWALLGWELMLANRTDEAILALTRAAALPHPKMHVCLTNLAVAEHAAGRTASARARLERLLDMSPGAGEAHGAYALILAQAGEGDAAERHFAECFRLAPAWAQGRVLRAEALVRAGRPDLAREEADRAVAMPGGRDAGALLAAALDCIDGLPGPGFARLRATWPAEYSDADVWAGMGDRLLDFGRPDAAEAAYARCVAADPRDPLSHYRLAVARERRGDTQGARAAAREAASLAPADAPWLGQARRLAQ